MEAAKIFQNGMILQREKPVRIWGKGCPGDILEIDIQGQHAETIVQESGQWEFTLDPLHTSVSESLVLKSAKEECVFSDIAVGEVWVAGGQSNMEFQMRFEKHRDEEIEICNYENLRFYDVPEICYEKQTEDFDYSSTAVWRKATREDMDYFSAVGYYFQKNLSMALNVPVGIIGCNWGGTTSCAWMKPDSVAKAGKPWMDDYRALIDTKDMNEYWERQRTSVFNDRGDLLHDPVNNFVLPKIRNAEEMAAFYASLNFTGMPEELLATQIPGILFEHMVKKIAPYTVRGVLWYQGESDDKDGRQKLYKNMLTSLVYDWREIWCDASLPFLIVQLPGFLTWAGTDALDYVSIRRSQEEAVKTIPNTWLCSISDAGEKYDIHPKNKKIVGERLALLARGKVYGEKILCSAPEMISAERKGKNLIFTFSNASGGLKVKGNEIDSMEVIINGQRQKFSFKILEEQLVLTIDDDVDSPINVAYAQKNWYQINLYNQADIPVIPFQICLQNT